MFVYIKNGKSIVESDNENLFSLFQSFHSLMHLNMLNICFQKGIEQTEFLIA